MNTNLKTFDGHIPDGILNENVELKKLLAVLNGMQSIREDEIFNYIRSFLQPLVSDIQLAKKYVGEWKAEYPQEVSLKCLDCLYRNYYKIYSGKGTIRSLEALLKCLLWINVEPTVVLSEYTTGKPLILFSDTKPLDWLPNDEDIEAEVGVPFGTEKWCPTLLGGTWSHHYNTVVITITCGYTPTSDFIQFLKDTIKLYIPMSKNFTNIILIFN